MEFTKEQLNFFKKVSQEQFKKQKEIIKDKSKSIYLDRMILDFEELLKKD